MRLFFALLPDLATRDRLLAAASRIGLIGAAKAVAPANLHVTVAFIGEVSDAELQIFRSMGPLKLHRRDCVFDVLEHWPESRAVVATSAHGGDELGAQTEELRAAVTATTRRGGAEKPWRAHVTLARKVAQAPVLPAILPIKWVSRSLDLISSKTGGDESVYTVVDSWPLLDKP